MPRSVPFFNYPHIFVSQEAELLSIIQDVCRRGAFILQQDVRDFERNFAEFTGAKYALGVANCTDGLIILLKAAGIGPGDEVIFSSHTFVATAAAIHHVGATPVAVDCGTDHLIDPASVEQAITNKTKAIMPTQLNGRTCNMETLEAICEKYGLLLVEDAAQAFGALYKGKAAGTFGLASAFSFYPAKNLGCFGDGGAIITHDETMYNKMVLLHNHGRNQHNEVVVWGMNSRLDNLQAAILNYKLARYQEEVNQRREMAALYQSLLSDVKELLLPPAPNSDPDRFDVFQNYEIEAERRDELQLYLREHGIGTLIQWSGKAVHQFEKLGFDVTLPYTERMFTRCLMLPMNSSLSNQDVEYVCTTIRQFYGY